LLFWYQPIRVVVMVMELNSLVTLISKWGHGSPVSQASFLPIFSFRRPSIVDLGSGPGQTDGQTDDGRQHLMPPPYGDGNITKY